MEAEPSAEPPPPDPGRLSRVRLVGLIVVATLLALVVALAAFPWPLLAGVFKSRIEKSVGGPVAFASVRRLDGFSFHPIIELKGLTAAGAAWAGPDKLARIGSVRVRFSAWSLALGRFRLDALELDDAHLVLVRRYDGTESWTGNKSADDARGASVLQQLRITNSTVTYRDAKQNRSFAATLEASAKDGIRLAGTGQIHGVPVRISARGAPIVDGAKGPWPYSAAIVGEAVAFSIKGTMPAPLDVAHLSGSVSTRASDLVLIDAIIEAGLPGTQPVSLTANVERNHRDWTVGNLKGTIGRSDIAGSATIVKRGGRTRINGEAHARQFDFDDLSSDEGLRIAAGKRARFGQRVVPDAAIDLATVSKTDGELALSVDRLLWRQSSPIVSMKAKLGLERSLLTLSQVKLGLIRGWLGGSIVIDQRRGGPRLALDLALDGARLSDFFPATGIDADLRGRLKLSGTGRTVRDAVATSTGAFSLVSGQGQLPARTASLLGQDVGRGFTTDKGAVAELRCIVALFRANAGRAQATEVVIDTSRARTDVAGDIDLATEALSLSMKGAPKRGSLLRLPGAVTVKGTVKVPLITVPKSSRSVGGILKMLGQALTGNQAPLAEDADCAALAGKALAI